METCRFRLKKKKKDYLLSTKQRIQQPNMTKKIGTSVRKMLNNWQQEEEQDFECFSFSSLKQSEFRGGWAGGWNNTGVKASIADPGNLLDS